MLPNLILAAPFLMMMELVIVLKSYSTIRTKVLESELMYHHMPLQEMFFQSIVITHITFEMDSRMAGYMMH